MGDGPYIANSPKVDAEVKEPKQKVIDTRPLYKCDECGHITRSLGGLEIHSKYHIHKSKFSCQFCTFSAAVKYKIDLHVKRCHSDMHNQKVAGSFKASFIQNAIFLEFNLTFLKSKSENLDEIQIAQVQLV